MRLSKVFLFLVIFGSIYGQDNLLLNVPVFVSENADKSSLLNDGDTDDSPMTFYDVTVKWAVFDMGDAFDISKIVMRSGDNQGNDPISFYIGDEFQPCKFHLQIKSYSICQTGIIQNQDNIEINCQGSENTGRYLAMTKGTFDSLSNLEPLSIIEIEAFGTNQPGHVYPSRPVLDDEDLEPITTDSFKISHAILNGVGPITVPRYSTALVYLNKNCQPIIWDPSTLYIFGLACQTADGKGRLTVFGKESYLSNLMSDTTMKILSGNIVKWLSPNSKNPSLVLSKTISTVADIKKKVKAGDILDFYTFNAYTKDVLDEIINLCLNGTIAISLDHTFWVTTSKDVINSFERILGTFYVEYTQNFVTWDTSQDFTITDDDFNDGILDPGSVLELMAVNQDYFIQLGNAVAQTLLQMSTKLILNSNIKSSLEKIITKYDPLINWICPCQVGPATDPNDRVILNIFSQLIHSQSLANFNYKAPCIDLFPYDFEESPAKETVTLTITAQTDSTNNPTGYYLQAGTTVSYEVINNVGDWTMSIGCHTDILDDGRPQWYRYPNIYTNNVNIYKKGQIYSPFGGVLWLCNDLATDSISITLSNVVATPFFNGRDKSASVDWSNQSKNPGLWSQIVGENIVFCEKSSNVRQITGENMRDLMKNNWDKLVRMDYAINELDWNIARPQIVVLDIMTSFGYGHSGYPIVVWYDWNPIIFNQTLIATQGSWGMCHEIGHNLQDSRWTYIGLNEVTNNLLCLFNYEKLWNLTAYLDNPNGLNDNKDDIISYLDSGADFDAYQNNPWLELAIYSQMANHFGWGFYKKVFKYYQDKNLAPSDDDDKITTWIKVTNKISGQNLLPLFDFWGISFSDELASEFSNLPCFFPDDFMIRFSQTRSDYVINKYGNCKRHSIYYEDYDPASDIQGTIPNFITKS